MGGGAFSDLAIHLLDAATQVAGPPEPRGATPDEAAAASLLLGSVLGAPAP